MAIEMSKQTQTFPLAIRAQQPPALKQPGAKRYENSNSMPCVRPAGRWRPSIFKMQIGKTTMESAWFGG